ncbi:carboxylate-amine ligase [Loktanella sp. PT4BL]|jgi:carboxylate-amine ligase|uniref:carboxylate-amine ligase n=1 Tax=Loktanella sp. PT4BL TaxID=2135611 RepID=UPI000D753079|nr:carboxylate-amine ligase [Loktanella sp. PT4BL]PXW70858.1 carboxylate-amine ligase [Loktanella sp. PT4BL]
MVDKTPPFTMGIEEEYLLVDQTTFALAQAPDSLIAACKKDLEGQVSPEFLQCQIEIGTGVCQTIGEARRDLAHLRRTVARHAADYGLAPIAASCHPFADWKEQHHTDKERYHQLRRDLAGVARRMLICGMHVHVGIPDQDTRIDLVNQLKYFLPHLHALSTSSPYWQGEDTGMNSYRLTVFDNLPRTGLPPAMADWAEFSSTVDTLIDLGLIEDASKIWWDLRPSSKFPTIESRICDVAPRMEVTLTLAALTQCLTRMLWRRSQTGEGWPLVQNFMVEENRWRAQRYGTSEGLIDFGRKALIPFSQAVDEILALIAEDAVALECEAEVKAAREIVANGTSADHQREVFSQAKQAGATDKEALSAVAASLVAAFSVDL